MSRWFQGRKGVEHRCWSSLNSPAFSPLNRCNICSLHGFTHKRLLHQFKNALSSSLKACNECCFKVPRFCPFLVNLQKCPPEIAILDDFQMEKKLKPKMSWKLVGFPSGLWKSSSSSTQKKLLSLPKHDNWKCMTSKRLRLPGQSGKWWWKQLHLGGEGPTLEVKVCSMKMKLLEVKFGICLFFPKSVPQSDKPTWGLFIKKRPWRGRWKADEFNRKRGSSINPFGRRPLSAELLVGDPEFPEGPGWQWSSPQRFFFWCENFRISARLLKKMTEPVTNPWS